MHHTLRFYGRYQRQFLRLYLSSAKLTAVPLLGKVVRRAAIAYGRSGHQGYVLTFQEAEAIIENSGDVALGPCNCRAISRNCETPEKAEILVGRGVEMFSQAHRDGFRRVSKQEAKDVLRECERKHLVHTVMKCRENLYAICNCCTCCCVPTRLRRVHGIETALVRDPDIVNRFVRQQLEL